MAEFTLKKQEAKTLRLNIGDKSYQVPLVGSLTPAEVAPLDTPVGTRAFFNRYLDQDVVDSLTLDDYNAITKAWVAACKEDNDPGES